MRAIYAESSSFDPYFNLSFEKYLFDNVQEDEFIFYLWQNEKTVVCGRNQNIYNECNLTSLESLGGKVARRTSGGGAVFHDIGNLNFTFIARDGLYNIDRQLAVIEKAVSSFGLPVERTGRNDVEVSGKKFSGNAFHKFQGVNLHHGTIMIDVNTSLLKDVLNVKHEKLKSHGVESVTSRVVNLSELSNEITVESMKVALKSAFLEVFDVENFTDVINVGGKSVISGTEHTGWAASGSMLTMLQSIAINQAYFQSDDWLYGRKISFTNEFKKKFDWGEINFQFEVKGGIIMNARVFSDSLYPEFIEELEASLLGLRYLYDDFASLLDSLSKKYEINLENICKDIKQLVFESI